MTRPIRIGQQAADELAEAVRWYEAQRAGLGTELLDAVSRALSVLADYSEIGSIFGQEPSVRYLPLRRFPYRVIYRVDDEALVIVAFAHARRRPGYWHGRV